MVRCGEGSASGKSVLSLVVLGARSGDVLTVIAEGPDAAAAVQALDHLFERQSMMRSINCNCAILDSNAIFPVSVS